MANFIVVPDPHMVLNSHNVPPPDYQMTITWKVPQSEPVDNILNRIAKEAKGMTGGKLATVIFNAHGNPGSVDLGQGIMFPDASRFTILNGLVSELWIVACQVAASQVEGVSGTPNGKKFCQDLAEACGAAVTAAVRNQKTGAKTIPAGHVDEWEGQVLTFFRGGKGKPAVRQSE